jgi:hypothetical protein
MRCDPSGADGNNGNGTGLAAAISASSASSLASRARASRFSASAGASHRRRTLRTIHIGNRHVGVERQTSSADRLIRPTRLRAFALDSAHRVFVRYQTMKSQ